MAPRQDAMKRTRFRPPGHLKPDEHQDDFLGVQKYVSSFLSLPPAVGDLWARAHNVYDAALRAGRRYVWEAIVTETGYGLRAVLQGVIFGLVFSLAILGLSTAIGGAVGAAAGFAVSFFAGGELAVPGALLGGELGFDAGVWLLGRLGLGLLVVYIGSNLKEIFEPLNQGVQTAWNAVLSPNPLHERAIDSAARLIAKAAGVFMRVVLEGIVAYLTAKGTAMVASRLSVLVNTLRKSRLGKDFANWIERNHQKLIEDPNLKGEPERAAPKVMKPILVTAAVIRNAMRGARLRTQQESISIPMVQRYVKMLEEGQTPPAIKVDGDIIVEGNHRYVAGRIFGKEPPIIPGVRAHFKEKLPTIDWDKVKLDPIDWGNH
jgi:hypothetical protein